jgi:uncharacterized membrane protein required for colicin V production
LLSIGKGYYYRFNLEFAGFIGILIGVMVASNGNDFFGDFLNAISSVENNKNEATFTASFMISILGTWIGTLLIAKFANKAPVHHNEADMILGGFASFMKSIVIISYLLAVSYKIDYVKKHYKKSIDNSSVASIFQDFGKKILLNSDKRIEYRIRRVIKYAISEVDTRYKIDTNQTKDNKMMIRSLDDIHGQKTLDEMGQRIEKNYYQSQKYTKGYKNSSYSNSENPENSEYSENNTYFDDLEYKEDREENIEKDIKEHIDKTPKQPIKKPIEKKSKKSKKSTNINTKYIDDDFLDEIYQDTLEDVKSLDDVE